MLHKILLGVGLIATLVLAGCNSDTGIEEILNDDGLTSGKEDQLEPPAPEPNNPFPEPKTDRYDPPKAELGFYDYTRDGKKRNFVNHLTGGFEATIQFGQNLTVAPNGNENNWHPRLVSEREALLIVIPTESMGDITSLTALVTVNGASKGSIQLKTPSEQPGSDRTLQDDRPDVVFSKHAWTATLPWDWVVPGLELTLIDHKEREGHLAANDIDFAAPGQLVVNQIQLGFLTDYPGKEYMLNDPAEAATDYFQTIPAATMLLGAYEPIRLERVMVRNAKIYESPQTSETKGDVYSGDMREDVGKATFSTGINLANWGITSANLMSQQQPQLTQRAVLHHARGKYVNGDVNHGLSGGNGILTLINSSGNEFSHEIGHHYGLGHYPGADIGPDRNDVPNTPAKSFWDRHHADSGWGYIGYRNRMHTSIYWWDKPNTDWADWQAFQKIYYYSTDAMAGGRDSSLFSRYTLYTGYSTYLKIQPAFDKVQYSCDFNTNQVTGTGFIRWNKDTRRMEPVQPKVPTGSKHVWYNNGDGQGNYLKPRLCSVPVFTLLGGYDPETKTAVMYPAARSNLGNVFDLPAPTNSTTERRCWVQVDFASGQQKNIAVAPERMQPGQANRYNINLAQADKPSAAALYCQEPNQPAQQLDVGIEIPTDLAPMPAAVIVGKEHGYDALWQKEKPELVAALNALENQPIPILNERGQLLYNSWINEYMDDLSVSEQEQVKRYEEVTSKVLRLNRWMFAWKRELTGNNADADAALIELIEKLELGTAQALLPKPTNMTIGYDSCLRADTADAGASLLKAFGSSECTGAANESWVVDALGRIHNGEDLSQCIAATNPLTVTTCDLSVSNQVWNLDKLPMLAQGNKCMDMENGTIGTTGSRRIILYNCTNGQNQRLKDTHQDKNNTLLPLLHVDNLPVIQRLSL